MGTAGLTSFAALWDWAPEWDEEEPALELSSDWMSFAVVFSDPDGIPFALSFSFSAKAFTIDDSLIPWLFSGLGGSLGLFLFAAS